mgnify:CR=1 FL=1
MGTKKRFQDQIIAQILTCCKIEGQSKTQVVYASGLNFKTIVPYLNTLNKGGLIEIIHGEYPIYKITQKGEEALMHLQAIDYLIHAHNINKIEEVCEESVLD